MPRDTGRRHRGARAGCSPSTSRFRLDQGRTSDRRPSCPLGPHYGDRGSRPWRQFRLVVAPALRGLHLSEHLLEQLRSGFGARRTCTSRTPWRLSRSPTTSSCSCCQGTRFILPTATSGAKPSAISVDMADVDALYERLKDKGASYANLRSSSTSRKNRTSPSKSSTSATRVRRRSPTDHPIVVSWPRIRADPRPASVGGHTGGALMRRLPCRAAAAGGGGRGLSPGKP